MITWPIGSSEIVHEASAFHLEFFHKDLVFIVVIKAMTHYNSHINMLCFLFQIKLHLMHFSLTIVISSATTLSGTFLTNGLELTQGIRMTDIDIDQSFCYVLLVYNGIS